MAAQTLLLLLQRTEWDVGYINRVKGIHPNDVRIHLLVAQLKEFDNDSEQDQP